MENAMTRDTFCVIDLSDFEEGKWAFKYSIEKNRHILSYTD